MIEHNMGGLVGAFSKRREHRLEGSGPERSRARGASFARGAIARAAGAAAGILLCCGAVSAQVFGSATQIHRDLPTGILSNTQEFVSLRFMRHIWIVGDGTMALVVQAGGYGNDGLVLYKSIDEGEHWTREMEVANEEDVVSDGVMLPGGDILLVTSATSTNPVEDVRFIRLGFNARAKTWSIDPASPTTVFDSNLVDKASRATIAVDSNGVLWCGLRIQNTVSGSIRIYVRYSEDGGLTWHDTGNVFGSSSSMEAKASKVLNVGQRVVLIYHDEMGSVWNPEREKAWAYREDAQPLGASWSSELIAEMASNSGDSLGSHWSVAADPNGDLHLSYQDEGIKYLRYDAGSDTWVSPETLSIFGGNYNQMSVEDDGDLYIFAKFTYFSRFFIKQKAGGPFGFWSRWGSVNGQSQTGFLRMMSPERFGNRLPVLYQVNANAPYELLYSLYGT